ncbi:hypothetical protein CAEBREN_04815 [Caenorhabditis brenneri]|uniref:Nuclear receptor domain-containing protein n=1 Tax=Caenorhabditis brenneri TaxID=135651 RepID=G0NMS4_CAEBE|nr:hypothetical protein CAEBREN_04815 [Caenorhabditis brenneri]
MPTSQPSSSSSSPFVSSSPVPSTSSCEVCGDTVHSKQYGVASCLGCIVFFRRAIQNKSEFRCWRNGKCSITLSTRCSCRCCRLTKCFEVGMNPEAVTQRDQLGPRDPRSIPNQKTAKQVQPDKTYSSQTDRKKDNVTTGDVNLIFKLGMRNAIKWANQFEPYRKLSSHDRKDHCTSANELGDSLEAPFKVLKIDEFELSALKTLLLLSPSFSGRACCLNSSENIDKCLSDLMEHCTKKDQEKGPERFGEVILLLGSIRYAVKSFYNKTKIPGVLNIDNFDPSIKDVFLS